MIIDLFKEFQNLSTPAEKISWLNANKNNPMLYGMNLDFDNLVAAWQNHKNYVKPVSEWNEEEDVVEFAEGFEE